MVDPGKRILLADDSPLVLAMLTNLLESRGYQVVTAKDGIEATQRAYSEGADLIVLDIFMPRMNGYQVCRLLKNDPVIADVPVIILTGSEESGSAEFWSLQTGANAFLVKGCDREELVRAVERLLAARPPDAPDRASVALGPEEILSRVSDLMDRELYQTTVQRIELQTILRNLQDGVLTLDLEQRISSANQALCHMLGADEQELLGQACAKALGSAGKVAGCLFERALAGEEGIAQDAELESRFGERLPVAVSAVLLRDFLGKTVGGVCMVQDITRRKEIERLYADLAVERQRSEQLLLNILPASIAERLKRHQTTIADSFAEVTVLFADIVNFTPLSAQQSPTDLVRLLGGIFSAFDDLAQKHGLEKIKTIGDAYMVVGGLPEPRADHAEAVAEMALDMLQEIGRFRGPDGQSCNLRIGINTGPVVAGVIGTRKFSYDLWGDTVNVASRMESQGVVGAIQVTPATYKRLENRYRFEAREPFQVKGRGQMVCYLLTGRKEESRA
jgi:PAS domain S-box-containing protein